ncbi:MAG: iron-sulfur cluster assembly scaffold protein [Alphaproteobacteria bacterium]
MSSLDLYQRDLLRAAADASHAGRLPRPDGSATVNNPLCGDKITIDITLAPDNTLSAYTHETEACVLCQASAGLIGSTLEEATATLITETHQAVTQVLEQGSGTLPTQAKGFGIFAAVTDHTARHACVLMPFEALTQAIKEAQAKTGNSS